MQASTFSYKGKCWDVFAFQWCRVEIGRDEIFALLVYTANGGKRQLPSKLQLCQFSKAN